MDFIESMQRVNNNIPATMSRFADNQNLWQKFVFQFADDKVYQTLICAWKSQDTSEMEYAAHTLKGVSANLGFSDLAKACGLMGANLRAAKADCLQRDMDGITEQYQKVIEAIDACRQPPAPPSL